MIVLYDSFRSKFFLHIFIYFNVFTNSCSKIHVCSNKRSQNDTYFYSKNSRKAILTFKIIKKSNFYAISIKSNSFLVKYTIRSLIEPKSKYIGSYKAGLESIIILPTIIHVSYASPCVSLSSIDSATWGSIPCTSVAWFSISYHLHHYQLSVVWLEIQVPCTFVALFPNDRRIHFYLRHC